ncbi:hypothetical protein [uncultured Amphritea sp.]|uniref:hypothetical protein n=1 Tax=uncultured Amphritea sp. TaxID=981605 RepID=UPI0026377238|nr:hypothetical protein [uncultured Amphritea sp.]
MNRKLVEFQEKWNLTVTGLAKVLGIQTSRSSDFLSGKRKAFPEYLSLHIETLNKLEEGQCKELIKKRVEAVRSAEKTKGDVDDG